MTRRTTPDNHVGPPAAGPYSPTVRIGNIIAVSGQAGLDPVTNLVVGDDIGSQTQQALDNIADVLSAADASLDDIVSVRVFLTDLSDFDGMNAVYKQYFSKPYPTRATVQVGLPPTMKIEIEALAVAPDSMG